MDTTLLEAYKKMVTIRVAEEQIAKHYLENKVMSFVHFYVGQEAVAVGVSDALSATDRVMGNHRSHGHYLAKGGDLKKMIAELLGKEAGCCKGKGGSMHMIDKSVGFVGSTPILGSSVPLACGSAFEQKYSKKDQITVAFVGDGASEEGVVYETYNLAGLFKLPLLIVIENNLYSVNSKIKDRRAEQYDTEKVVTGLGLKYVKADGNNYVEVAEKAKILVDGVRKGIPAVLECVTYRHMAHSAPIFDDAQGYREVDILEKRLEADPLKKVATALIQSGHSESDITKIHIDALTVSQDAIKFAVEAPYPHTDELYSHLYA